MTSNFVFRMLSATAVVFLGTAASAAQNPMDCVEEMTMPSVTPGIVTALPATIAVRILIGRYGRARKIDYRDAKPVATAIPFRLPALEDALNTFFKDGTRYVEACEGKTISFTVRYVVEGNATDRLYSSEVRFRPPNEFIVRSHPVIPALEPFRERSPK
jgi:hypothetical protein